MVAHFSELHDQVHQTVHALLVQRCCLFQKLGNRYFFLQTTVKRSLSCCQIAVHLHFNLSACVCELYCVSASMALVTFSPSSCWTLRLIRLNMNGFKIMCSRRSWCSFKVPLFSAWLSMSLENHSLNSSCESNSVGMMKCNRAHNSTVVV